MDTRLLLIIFLLLLATLVLTMHYLTYLHISYLIAGLLVLVGSVILSNLGNDVNSYKYDIFYRDKRTFRLTDQFLERVGIYRDQRPMRLQDISDILERNAELPLEDGFSRKFELKSMFFRRGFLIYGDLVFGNYGQVRKKLIAKMVYDRSIYEHFLSFSDMDRTVALNKVFDNLELDKTAATDSKFIFVLNPDELEKFNCLLNLPYANNSLLALRMAFGDVEVIS